MPQLAPWTSRLFDHHLTLELFPAVMERLRGTPPRAAALLDGWAAPLRTRRPDGSWSAHEHIGHLDDLHELDMRRIQDFASGAATLSAADMTNRRTVEAGHNATSSAVLLDRLRLHREELIRRLEDLDDGEMARTAMHPRLQRPMSVVDWMYFVAEHDDHHLAKAREAVRVAAAASGKAR
jgi:DinB superfamily